MQDFVLSLEVAGRMVLKTTLKQLGSDSTSFR